MCVTSTVSFHHHYHRHRHEHDFSHQVVPGPGAMDQVGPAGPSPATQCHLEEINAFDTRDGLYDCCWSECHPDILVAASGDGSVKVLRCSDFEKQLFDR